MLTNRLDIPVNVLSTRPNSRAMDVSLDIDSFTGLLAHHCRFGERWTDSLIENVLGTCCEFEQWKWQIYRMTSLATLHLYRVFGERKL